MKRLSHKPLATLLLLFALALAAGWQSRSLTHYRRAGLPTAHAAITLETPPALNLVLAGLGGFRGLIAEILWFRAARLQAEGRFLELIQLSEWITMLDPRAADAWVYNAWNLSYNVSIMMQRPEDRTRWVKSGISLLRDQGLPYNPYEPRLYRELAWLYQNKIGDDMDAHHLIYKLDLVATMTPLLAQDGSLLRNPENDSQLRALQLDPDLMANIESEFGKLDWRIAESHAIYWAMQGVSLAEGNELMMCRRAVYQPLMLSVFRGHFTGSLKEQLWQTAPNLDLALPTTRFMARTLELYPSHTLQRVQLHFLANVIRSASSEGNQHLTEELYHILTTQPLPANLTMPTLDQILQGWKVEI